jgi:cytochrome c-type biogenesis protein CcmH/NrfG
MSISNNRQTTNGADVSNNFALSRSVESAIFQRAILLAVGIAFTLTFTAVSFAQTTRSGSTTRGFLVYGDVKIDESKLAGAKPGMLEVILYTKGNQVVARQRINPNGRYRFMDIFDGDYWLVVELEGVEVARDSLFISKSMTMDVKHDLELEWRSNGGRTANGGGVVSASDLYTRSAPQNLLYQRSAKEVESKRYPDAIATLRELVAADPKDFPAWADLGMLYFVQKNFDDAEKSYASSLAANPTYFPAAFNLGKVQLAKKNYEPAIASFETALKLDPKSAAVNYFLGEAYLQIKKGSKAVGYLNEALTLDPSGMAEAHLRLAALYNGAGMKDKAVTEYEQFLKKKPDYPDRQKLEKYIADNKKP